MSVLPNVSWSLHHGSPFIVLQCTYLFKQTAIPLITGKATNESKVGNFSSECRDYGVSGTLEWTGLSSDL